MSIWLFIFCFVMFWVALRFLIQDQVERRVAEEVARQLDQQSELAQRQHRAAAEIRDQLRRTSHEMLEAAIDSGAQPTALDLDDFERPQR